MTTSVPTFERWEWGDQGKCWCVSGYPWQVTGCEHRNPRVSPLSWFPLWRRLWHRPWTLRPSSVPLWLHLLVPSLLLALWFFCSEKSAFEYLLLNLLDPVF